jgi:hypothetical protein
MRRLFSKQILATFIVATLLTVTGVAVADGTLFPSSINTVTEMRYSTTTITSGSSTYVSTETVTPYETLKTTTVWGTGTYTVTVTQTTCGQNWFYNDNDGCQGSTTTTTETTADYYIPLAMYYTATTNYPFYRQLNPIVIFPPKPHDSSYTETIGWDNSVSLKIVSNSTAYRDLGFYYVFQNLGSLNAFLATGGSHTITITGTGFAVNLWVNPGALNWGPGPVPPMEVITSSTGFAYGFSGTTGTLTVGASTPFYMTTAAGSCAAGGTYTISQLTTTCRISTNTPFALWIGVDSTSAGTTTATVNSIYSSPYP